MKKFSSITRLAQQEYASAQQIHIVSYAAYLQEAQLLKISDFPPLHRTVIDVQAHQAQYFGIFHHTQLAAVISLEQTSEAWQITSLVVAPQQQRQGLASRLMRYAIEHFTQDHLLVSTASANLPALTLYLSLGFIPYQHTVCRLADASPLQLVSLRLVHGKQ